MPTPLTLSPEQLDEVYQFILKELQLSDEHLDQLQNRGLEANDIIENGYGSLCRSGRNETARKLVRKFGEEVCASVPGMYKNTGVWRLAGSEGILIPVRLQLGLIRALKIRKNKAVDKNRFETFSSTQHEGPGPGANLHFPLARGLPSNVIRITEGELKADIATKLSGILTVSIPGVSSWRKAVDFLKSATSVDRVLLAFDMDSSTKPEVAIALFNFYKNLSSLSLKVEVETWDSKFKGIDDALLAKAKIDVFSGKDADDFLKKICGENNDSKNESKDGGKDFLIELSNKCTTIARLFEMSRNGEPMSNGQRFRLAQIAIGTGLSDDQIVDLYRHQLNFYEQITRSKILSIRTGHKTPACQKLGEDLSFCSGTCQAREAASTWSPMKIITRSRSNALPEIIVNRRQFRHVLKDTHDAIVCANQPEPHIFRRHNALVRLSRLSGQLEIEHMVTTSIYNHLGRIADWLKLCKKGDHEFVVPVPPDIKAARGIEADIDLRLPELLSVIDSPVFGSDKGLINEPGFHPTEAVYYDPESKFIVPKVPLYPTGEDIREARRLLEVEVLGDFPFAGPPDKAHAISAAILPTMRKMIAGCTPIIGVEAPLQGSGKGFLVNAVGIIATGQVPEKRVLAEDENEIRKMITAELSRGRQIFLIDNLPANKPLDSATLAGAITSEVWADRWLGQNKIVHFPNQVLWLTTGNNPIMTGELARRYVRCRIDTGRDRPWLRAGFRHPNLMDYVTRNRPQLYWATLVLIQAWIAQGMPLWNQVTLGSFEEWGQKMGGVLDVAGIPGFLGNLSSAYEAADREGQPWREFFMAWWNEYGSQPQKPSDLDLFCERNGLMMELRGTGNEKSRQTILGAALKSAMGRVYDVYRLEVFEDKKNKGSFYQLAKVTDSTRDTESKGGEHGTTDPAEPKNHGSAEGSAKDSKSKFNICHSVRNLRSLKGGTADQETLNSNTDSRAREPNDGVDQSHLRAGHGEKRSASSASLVSSEKSVINSTEPALPQCSVEADKVPSKGIFASDPLMSAEALNEI